MPPDAPLPDLPEQLFLAVDHVGIAVPDLDAALRTYRAVFGLVAVHEETNEEQGVREAMLAVGPEGTADGGTRLQLLAPLHEDSAIARFLDRSGPGLQQLAYRVADVEEAARVMRARGVRVLYDEPRRGTAGSRINFLHPRDCGGVLVELVEPPQGRSGRDTRALRTVTGPAGERDWDVPGPPA